MLEVLVVRLDPHRADLTLNQLTDRVVDHGGGHAGPHPEAVGEVGGDVILAPRNVDLQGLGLAKRDDPRVEPMHQGTQRQEVEVRVTLAHVQTAHGKSLVRNF